jgi:lactobin A/cerein 7B family class IIb bacteriocin
MKTLNLQEMTVAEMESVEGGSLALAIGICFLAGFLTGVAIVYFAD